MARYFIQVMARYFKQGMARYSMMLIMTAVILITAAVMLNAKNSTDIKGKVTNPQGKPYTFLTVQLITDKMQTSTDKNGEFIFRNVEPGEKRFYCYGAGSRPKDTTFAVIGDNSYYTLIVEDSYVIKDDIVVTGTRTAKQIENHPICTEVISKDDIKMHTGTTLDRILADETGLNLVDENGRGVQIQGLDPQYAMILIDGEPLIGRNGGVLDLERLAVGNIERVEIIKGPSSSLYGSHALAGVINIITQKPQNPFGFELHSRYATHNTIDLNASAELTNDSRNLGWNIFVNRLSSDGYSDGANQLGNVIPKYVNYTATSDIFYKFSEFNDLKLGVRLNTENQDNQFQVTKDETDFIIDDNSRLFDLNLHASYKHQLNEDFNFETRFYTTSYETIIDYKYRESGEDYDYYTFDQFMTKAELQSNYMIGRTQVLTFGGGAQFEKVEAQRIAKGGKSADLYYAFLQDDIFISSQSNLIGSLRYDYHSDYGDYLSPKIATSYKFFDGFTARASVGSGFKAPSFQQLYMDWTNSLVGYRVYGTKFFHETIRQLYEDGVIVSDTIPDFSEVGDLSPEKSWSVNAGITFGYLSWLDIKLNVFRNNLYDMIDVQPTVKLPNGQYIWTYFNLNRVFTQGIETDLHFNFWEGLHINLGYQYLSTGDQDVIEQIDNEEIYKIGATGVNRPVQMVEYGGLFNRSKHSVLLKIKYISDEYDFNAFLSGRYRSRYGFQDMNGNKILDDDSEYASDYSLWDLTASKKLFDALVIQAGIENVFDYRPKRFQLSNPGRLLFIGIRYTYN